ncbi:MAG: NifU family protein, partial [Saprospiraceae bacterium]|nr:NifU family protein [Saprospiraceae bacterium]
KPVFIHYFCSKFNIMTDISDKKHLNERVEAALETIRPHLRVDGGDVELVEVTDDMHVKIRWMGMCQSCSMSDMTLRAGIQEAIRSKIPEILGVEAVS